MDKTLGACDMMDKKNWVGMWKECCIYILQSSRGCDRRMLFTRGYHIGLQGHFYFWFLVDTQDWPFFFLVPSVFTPWLQRSQAAQCAIAWAGGSAMHLTRNDLEWRWYEAALLSRVSNWRKEVGEHVDNPKTVDGYFRKWSGAPSLFINGTQTDIEHEKGEQIKIQR